MVGLIVIVSALALTPEKEGVFSSSEGTFLGRLDRRRDDRDDVIHHRYYEHCVRTTNGHGWGNAVLLFLHDVFKLHAAKATTRRSLPLLFISHAQ